MYRLFIAILTCVFVAVPAAWSDEPAVGKRVALLIGVAKYEGTGLTNLKYAEKDVTDLKAVLEGLGYKVTLVTRAEWKRTDKDDLDPTAENIRDHLNAVTRNTKPEDTLIVAFSGHGVHLKATDKLYYCPSRANLAKPETLVAMEEVMAALKPFDSQTGLGCRANSKVLLMDACRNDPSDGRATGDGRMSSVTRPLIADPPGGTVALFSCSKGQISHESDTFQRGFLMHFVIDGLNGKAAAKSGDISWDKLVAHVKEEVPSAVVEQKGPKITQLPESLGRVNTLMLGRVVSHQRWAGREEYLKARQADYGIGRKIDKPDAIASYRKAVELGHPLAKIELADFLRSGHFIAKDEARAKRLEDEALPEVRLAASHGFAEAQDYLALLYAEGRAVAKDEKEAFTWYRKAAEQNDPNGMLHVGNAYALGTGVDKDEKEAVKWFRKAADRNHVLAFAALGDMFASGSGVEKDEKEALVWYRKAAEQNESDAQNSIGLMYQDGRGVAKDEQEAVKWFLKAAEQLHADAQNNLGMAYYSGLGVEKDVKKSFDWIQKAAEQNHATAQASLGNAYSSGTGVEKDEKEAVKWYRKAADQGHPDGQFSLSLMYAEGLGIEKDEKQAIEWLRKAVDQNHAASQTQLGYMYSEGGGVVKDDKEAVSWFRKAADQNDDGGQSWLAQMYEQGRGLEKDEKEAAKWYRKAADQGNSVAQNNLGLMYEEGRGVEKDVKEAAIWYGKAADQGNETAKENLKRLNEPPIENVKPLIGR